MYCKKIWHLIFMAFLFTFLLVGGNLYGEEAGEKITAKNKKIFAEVDKRYPDGVGFWRELFLDDDYLVETSENIIIVSAQAAKLVTEPVIKQDKPWELTPPGYTNVMYDDEEKNRQGPGSGRRNQRDTFRS